MSDVALAHSHPECTGNWRLVGADPIRAIQCDRCKHSYPYSRERRLKAVDENQIGIYLRRLSNEGADAMKEEGPSWDS